jgi:histidine triad (HIT) family protein
MKNENCIFCKIAAGIIPVPMVWKDKKHISFLDANPINPGHTLLVPRKHTDYIFDLSDSEYRELMSNAKKIAKILKNKLKPKRIGLAVEGFGVPHVHVHLVPLNRGNELNPERAKHMDETKLKLIAEKIIGK